MVGFLLSARILIGRTHTWTAPQASFVRRSPVIIPDLSDDRCIDSLVHIMGLPNVLQILFGILAILLTCLGSYLTWHVARGEFYCSLLIILRRLRSLSGCKRKRKQRTSPELPSHNATNHLDAQVVFSKRRMLIIDLCQPYSIKGLALLVRWGQSSRVPRMNGL